MAGAISAPDAVFLLSGFFRVPLMPVVAIFHIWKFILAFILFGPAGAILYVIIGPAIVVSGFLGFAEANFHLLKYIRR